MFNVFVENVRGFRGKGWGFFVRCVSLFSMKTGIMPILNYRKNMNICKNAE